MKKLFIIALSLISLVGCNDYLDVNKDPNNPVEMDNKLLIPSAQGFIAAVVGGDMHNTAAFMAQYCDQMPEANQYNNLAEYSFQTDLFNRSYSNLYSGALKDLDIIRNQASAKGLAGDYFIATVLRAYTFQVLSDYLDKAPYSEALQGSSNPMPKWDNGEDIYAGILSELNEAQSKLGNAPAVSGGDLMYEGNINKWIQFANALRLRIYMRSSTVQDNSAKIKALIDEGNFFSGDVKMDVFADEESKRNPWYQTNAISLAKNHVGSYPIISYLKATTDPRIASMFVVAKKSGEYEGMLPGSKTQLINTNKNDAYSGLVYYAKMPVYFITQSELQFFLAEAYLRFYNDDAKAKASYEAAIDANFYTTRELNPETFKISDIIQPGRPTAWDSAASIDDKLRLIGMQKWVALCMINNTEAWSEVRRMNYPKLSSKTAEEINTSATGYIAGDMIAPWVNTLGEQNLVKSLWYPQRAVDLNKNTPAQKKLTDPVWWDK